MIAFSVAAGMQLRDGDHHASLRPDRECSLLWTMSVVRSSQVSSGVFTACYGVAADRSGFG